MSGQDLGAMFDARRTERDKISEAQANLRQIEKEAAAMLIDEGHYELISVNWDKAQRFFGRNPY
tara:strand:+ start:3334 stop:3525 length:192 start_codon:yes stop_codon:yes gene_type:complete